MHYRPATEPDIACVRQKLRQSYKDEISQTGREVDEMWESYLSREGREVTAFINDQGQCAALMIVIEINQEFRPGTGFGVLFPTHLVDEEPIGFLRAMKKWLGEAVYQGKTWSQLWTWISADRPVNLNMVVKFLGFKLEKTHSSDEPGVPDMHLVYHERAWLEKP